MPLGAVSFVALFVFVARHFLFLREMADMAEMAEKTDRKISREDALALLKNKYSDILGGAEQRYPRRSDFSESEVNAIKSFFGPWPRALEEAGIKPRRDDGAKARREEKRIRVKRERNLCRREQKAKQNGRSVGELDSPANKN